jgi:CheY-like chemotaxis protein/anti-sigma regulatory factor (Ser/Thr protein kinase)
MNSNVKRRVLIVDDDSTNRLLLKAQLAKLDYSIIEAKNGLEAVQIFKLDKPDIILMDVLMPVMDGFEATRIIKKEMKDHFIPIIFLTALTDEKDLAKCLEIGGDDFLSKPASLTMLKAKLISIERSQALNKKLNKQHEQLLEDEALAQELFSRVVMAQNDELDKLGVIYKSASTFSGDLILSRRSPTGDLYIMLGDFTGHGLNAAIGAIPVSQIFNSMTKKGYDLITIIVEINKKLYELLPDNMFCAAGFVSISADLSAIKTWNAGIPDMLVFNTNLSKEVHRFRSTHLPLGITYDADYDEMDAYHLNLHDVLFIMSDGVIEAVNSSGQMYGMGSLIISLTQSCKSGIFAKNLEQDLDHYTNGVKQRDDISFLSIVMSENLSGQSFVIEKSKEVVEKSKMGSSELVWNSEYQFNAQLIKENNPVPLLVNQIKEMEHLMENENILFTILSEFYMNAVEHGLLKLESEIKSSSSGFDNYFMEKIRRLELLEDGFIRIKIESYLNGEGSRYIIIRISDSGDGFKYENISRNINSDNMLCGRGIPLLYELCESVHYEGNGNTVEAVVRL